jgi:peptidylprolyl isomerase
MKKTIIIWAVVIFLLIEFFIMIAPGDTKFVDTNPPLTTPLPLQQISKITPTSQVPGAKTTSIPQQQVTKLEITDLKVGTGKEVKPGDKVVMNYRGTLTDGKEFDSSYKRNQPFETIIGTGQVIKGWDQGIPGMKVGGKRRLVIPSDLAYGKQGVPPTILPDATLIFEVELLSIK